LLDHLPRAPDSNTHLTGYTTLTLGEIFMNSSIRRSDDLHLVAFMFLGVFTSGLAVMPVFAAHFDAPEVTVQYQDLDLSNRDGATILLRRIRAAADKVCSSFDRRDFLAKSQFRECTRTAVSQAVSAVGEPELTAAYSSKVGPTSQSRLEGVSPGD
jgi:UrcA family protein